MGRWARARGGSGKDERGSKHTQFSRVCSGRRSACSHTHAEGRGGDLPLQDFEHPVPRFVENVIQEDHVAPPGAHPVHIAEIDVRAALGLYSQAERIALRWRAIDGAGVSAL